MLRKSSAVTLRRHLGLPSSGAAGKRLPPFEKIIGSQHVLVALVRGVRASRDPAACDIAITCTWSIIFERMWQVLVRLLRVEGGVDWEAVAARTPGFVGADLAALVKEAAASAVTRIFSTLGTMNEVHLFSV